MNRTRLYLGLAVGVLLLAQLGYITSNRARESIKGDSKDDTKIAASGPEAPGGGDAEPGNSSSQKQGNKTAVQNQPKGAKPGVSPRPSPDYSLPPNTLPMTSSLSPTCGTRGTLMTLKIETRKGAALSIAVRYYEQAGPYWTGYADNEGKFTYTWVIGPDVSNGPAIVHFGAADHTQVDEYSGSSTGEAAQEIVHFTVADKC